MICFFILFESNIFSYKNQLNEYFNKMKKELITKRLRLIPVKNQDLDFLFSFLRNDNIKKYLCDNRNVEKAFVKSIISNSDILFDKKGIGLWLINSLDKLSPIGFCGFFEDQLLELIFAIHPDNQKHGYATESASKVIEYFNQLDLIDEIYAKIDKPNIASHVVIAKMGMSEINEEKNQITGGDIKVYKMM